MQKKAIVIFSGFNQRAVIAFLRVLSANNVSFGIIAKSVSDTIFLSKYKKNVLYVRKTVSASINDILDGLQITKRKLNADKLIIAPSTEYLNRFILKNRPQFEAINCFIPLVKESLYKHISDKYSFSRLCEANGIKVPSEYADICDIQLPFVAKPKQYYSKSTNATLSPVIIQTKKQKLDFINQYCVEDFYFQAFIEGKSRYLLYYFDNNHSVYKFSQENLIQQADGKSMVAAVSSDFHFSDESTKYERLFKKIKFTGFVMVEEKGEGYMIEANPRFWGPSQLFVDANSKLFEAFLYDYNFVSNKPPFVVETQKNILYFWFGGIIKNLCEGKDLEFHNYNSDLLIEKYPTFISSDIYMREDTYEIFKEELKNN